MRKIIGKAVACAAAWLWIGASFAAVKDSAAGEYAWRGVHLDEARHFFGKECVKHLLDRMAEAKLNVFHWHLTDDQGWRLEIRKYPNLTVRGAKRKLVKDWKPQPVWYDAKTAGTYGPYFYTRADVAEIVAYAKARGIEIVPEIEMPGHSLAALASYPDLCCFPEMVRTNETFLHPSFRTPGKNMRSYCIGSDETVKFLEGVLDEVCEMFPGKVIHIGGDEAPRGNWEICPKCRARMKAEGLKSPAELQGWLMNHFVRYLAKKGRVAMGWEEILAGKPDPKDVIAQCWHGPDSVRRAVEAGYRVVLSPPGYLYFDFAQGIPGDTHRYNGDGASYAKVRSFDPLAGIPEPCRARVLGAECCNWSELTVTPAELEHKLWPRASALAEVLTSPKTAAVPRYHFVIPGDGNPGDSNGAFWHNGRYHLMYLYKRADGYAWGHVSSTDLINWKAHPDAIAKYEKSPGGCYSGGAFVDDDGKAYLSYWMLWGPRGLGLAVGEGDFDTFTNLKENPVVRSTHWGWTLDHDEKGNEVKYGSADPSNIWKKDGRYYMIAGNICLLNDNGRKPDSPEAMKGDCAYLFESTDLKTWRYRHPFYQRRINESRATGWTDPDEDCMCPSFLPLTDAAGKPTGKHLLLFISHNRGCQYYIGTYDRKNDKFLPESHGRMTWQDKSYFAPEALVDGHGRQLIWTWLVDNRKDEFKRFGQTGVYGLPRSVWLAEDGTLGMAPAEEVKTLRRAKRDFGSVDLAKGKALPLDGFAGDCCELELQLDGTSAKNFALELKASADGTEKTIVRLDAERGELVFDATASNREAIYDFCKHVAVERAPFRLKSGEKLKLRVFIDGPIVEVCANDRQMITRRVYVQNPKSTAIRLVAAGGELSQAKVMAWECGL